MDHEPLARMFAAAFIANKLGISYNTAFKTYCGEDKPVGPLWLALAKTAHTEATTRAIVHRPDALLDIIAEEVSSNG